MKTMMVVGMLMAGLAASHAAVVDLKDRIATLRDREGKAYENVRLSRLDQHGLMYFYTNTAGGGRMKLSAISEPTKAELGISNDVAVLLYQSQVESEELARQRTAAYHAARSERAEREVNEKRDAAVELLRENIGRGRLYEELTTGKDAVEIQVGTAWSALTLKEKTSAAQVALTYGRTKHPSCEVVRIKNIYTRALLGRYYLNQGLDLK